MPVDPMTGQMIPYGSGTQDTPLAMRLLEDMPGIASVVGFNANRGSNTILRGGYMDDSRIFAGRRADRYRIFSGTAQPSISPNQYVGSSARRRRMAAGNRQNFLRSSRLNTFTMRPRAFSRFHSVSAFGAVGISGGKTTGAYTPFMGSQFLGKIPGVASFTGASGEGAFGPGLLSFITAGTRADRLERRALAGSARARGKLGAIDTNISRLAGMNNPSMLRNPIGPVLPQSSVISYSDAVSMNARARGGLSASEYVNAQRAATRPLPGSFMSEASASRIGVAGAGSGTGQVGVRGNLLASSMAGEGTRYMAGYFRGAMGYADVAGLEGRALKGAERAVSSFATALQKQGLQKSGEAVAKKALSEGVFKTIGRDRTFQMLATKEGAQVLGARALGLAIPGLNILATASLAYDLGKMGGEIVKSGINLARDAAKSIQGSIYKPLFGMGYVDTEAAATSRSRGVMAIQNSRLNARSMLGSEAGMMAARYG